jgi:hypothetical protein
MSAPDAMSESLAFPDVKRRAVASRSYRVKITPSNGQNFTAGQTVNIDMPSNLSGTYCNWNQCYLKAKVTATGGNGVLDRCASAGFCSRVQAFTSGSQLMDLPNHNVLMTILMDTDSSPSFKAGYGNILYGTKGGIQEGETLLNGVARTFCIPFIHPFSMTTPHRMMPLFSSAPVQFKLTLASIAECLKSSAVTGLTFEEIELVCVFTELSPGAQAQVDQMSGGVYNILACSYQNVGTTMAAGTTAVTANLGISVSSLERIIVCHRPTSSLVANAFSLGNRTKNYLKQYQFFVNGESFPALPVVVENNSAEALAEYLLSDHSLVNFDKQSSFNIAVTGNTSTLKTNGLDGRSAIEYLVPYNFEGANALGTESGASPTLESNIGSFITAVEMETGLSDGRSQRIYSGVSTISSTVNYRGVYGAPAGETILAAQIDFFAQFTILLSLNSRGTNVWSVSI